MGLERYVNRVVEEKDISLRKYLDWDCGNLNVSNKEIAEKIVGILNDSGEFTVAHYDEQSKRIRFGNQKIRLEQEVKVSFSKWIRGAIQQKLSLKRRGE